jgi:hypothetical protein
VSDKKSFILYLDQQDLFNKLPDDIAGKLIKHIFSYVNCEDPKSDELIIDVAFESIKQSLKRDLGKWAIQREQRSQAGKASAEKRANEKQRKATTVETRSTNPTVSVSDSVSVNDIKDTVGKIQPEIIQSAFEHTWKVWSQVKKTIDVKDNSSKKDAKDKGWSKLFNSAYCKANTDEHFRNEVNAVIKEIKKTHQPSEFNSYANMHFKRFLNQESWRKENV